MTTTPPVGETAPPVAQIAPPVANTQADNRAQFQEGLGIVTEVLTSIPIDPLVTKVARGTELVSSTLQKIDSIASLQASLAGAQTDWQKSIVRGKLDQTISGLFGAGFSAIGLLGGGDKTLSQVSQYGGVGVQTFSAIQGIDSSLSALRQANAANNATGIAEAGKGLATSIISGISAGFSILGLFAGNNQTLQMVSQIGGLGANLASMLIGGFTPIGVIGLVLGIFNLFGLFGGAPKMIKLTDKLDVTGDGSFDSVQWQRKKWDYYYNVNPNDSGLKINKAEFHVMERNSDSRVSTESGRRFRGNSPEKDYFLDVNFFYEALFPGITGEARVGTTWRSQFEDGVEITKEQYDTIVSQFGTSGTINSDNTAGINYLRSIAAENGVFDHASATFIQTEAAHGMNFYLDVNGDGVLDRVQQYMDLSNAKGPDYANDPNYRVNFRDANGREYRVLHGDDLQTISQEARMEPYVYAYIASHTDLMDAFRGDLTGNFAAALADFQANGETRGVTFDATGYLLANPDLLNQFGGDLTAATKHYIQTGVFDNRATWTDSVDTILQHSAIATKPGEYLAALGEWIPNLKQLFQGIDLRRVSSATAAEITRSILVKVPQAASYVVMALLGRVPSKDSPDSGKVNGKDVLTPLQQAIIDLRASISTLLEPARVNEVGGNLLREGTRAPAPLVGPQTEESLRLRRQLKEKFDELADTLAVIFR